MAPRNNTGEVERNWLVRVEHSERSRVVLQRRKDCQHSTPLDAELEAIYGIRRHASISGKDRGDSRRSTERYSVDRRVTERERLSKDKVESSELRRGHQTSQLSWHLALKVTTVHVP